MKIDNVWDMNKKQDVLLTGLLMLLFFTLGIFGCNRTGRPEKDEKSESVPGAAVAMVNGEKILSIDMKEYLFSRSAGAGNIKPQILRDRLQERVKIQILAQEARQRKLDLQPAVKFTLQQILAQKLLEQEVTIPVMTRIVSSEEKEKYYRDHIRDYVRPRKIRIADIFIAVPENSSVGVWEEKKNRAEAILAEALHRKGDRFAFSSLIRNYSDKHPLYTKGDTGYFDELGQPVGIEDGLVQSAFKLRKKGMINPEVVQTRLGYHIIMLVADRARVERKYEEVAGEITQRIKKEELSKKRDAFISALVKKASLEIYEKELLSLSSAGENARPMAISSQEEKSSSGPPVFTDPQSTHSTND